MIRKTLIALAAIATLATGMAATAEAKTNIDFNIDIGGGYHGGGHLGGGYYPDYGYGGYYDDEDCFYKIKKVKVWNKWQHKYMWKKKKVLVCY